MNQRRFIQDLDARINAALFGAGMGDTATYTAPGYSGRPVRVYVDHGITRLGMYGAAADATCTVTLFRADIPEPAAGAVVQLGADSYTLRLLLDQDESVSVWGAS